jgi:hypothetical protein
VLKQIIKDPSKWPGLLKRYTPRNENITIRRGVIRDVLNEIVKEKIMANGSTRFFRLNQNEFIINDKRQPNVVHQRFKDKFLKESGIPFTLVLPPGMETVYF